VIFLARVSRAFTNHNVEYAIAGGHAVALLGAVRGTVDVDIVLAQRREQFLAAEAALWGLGLKSRLPLTAGEVFDHREDYVRDRNLLAWSFINPTNPTELVDVLIAEDLAKLRTQRVDVEGLPLPIVAVDDLIAMKKAAGRPQDLEDVRALEKLWK
jgi:hypothetical protein